MKKNDKELNIELALERLEIIVSKMESGEVSLEKSLVLFEEGMNLIKECQGDLEKAEQRVEHLINGSKELKGPSGSSTHPLHASQLWFTSKHDSQESLPIFCEV